jgi:hypothetical protein
MSGMMIRSPILRSKKTPKPPDLDPIENFDPGMFAAAANPAPGIDRDNWKLNPIAFRHLKCVFATSYMDLFAMQDNRQTCSLAGSAPPVLGIGNTQTLLQKARMTLFGV